MGEVTLKFFSRNTYKIETAKNDNKVISIGKTYSCLITLLYKNRDVKKDRKIK